MMCTELKLVKQIPADDQQMTVDQLAQYFEVSVNTIRRRLEKLGIEPDVKGCHGGDGLGGSMASTYQFRKIRDGFSEFEAKTVSADAKAVILHDAIENLRNDDSKQATEAIMANTLGFMQMLYERLQKQEDTVEQLEQQVEVLAEDNQELSKELDISTSVCTVETYAINHRLTCTRTQAGVITKKLKALGYMSDGKVPSKYDNNLPATVWKIEILDKAYELGFFG